MRVVAILAIGLAFAIASVGEAVAQRAATPASPVTIARPRIRGLGKEPAAKAASVIAYLAFHRDVSSQRLRETFWP